MEALEVYSHIGEHPMIKCHREVVERTHELLQTLIEVVTTLGSTIINVSSSTSWYFSSSQGVLCYIDFTMIFVYGLCKFIDLSTFYWHVSSIKLADVVATI